MNDVQVLIDELQSVWEYLSDEEKAYAENLITGLQPWCSLSGPQTDAVKCEADELFYGGAAGGGKTDLLVGVALTRHTKSIIYRREATQLVGIINRMAAILGGRDGFSGQDKIWRVGDRAIEFGSVKDLGDEEKYQGRPHDLKGFDEITHFVEFQYSYLNGWKRTETEGQRVRTVCTGNPPHRPEGFWVKKYWGPWFDRNNPLYKKVEAGELAYYFINQDGTRIYLREPEPQIVGGREIVPRSLCFIPSRVTDNPYYMKTGYDQQLNSLPEPLRSQLRDGSFDAVSDDDPYQVIPTKWVREAMDRWEERPTRKGEMSEMGVDPARGGRDNTIIARRHDVWYDELIAVPGGETPDGPTVTSLIVQNRRHDCPVVIDIIGIGSSVVDSAAQQGLHTIAHNSSSKAPGTIGNLRFMNRRSWIYWQFREALNPENDLGVMLPPDDDLLSELCAHQYQARPSGIYVLAKEEVKKVIGRSPDRSDAVVQAWMHTPKRKKNWKENIGVPKRDINEHLSQPKDFNPYFNNY